VWGAGTLQTGLLEIVAVRQAMQVAFAMMDVGMLPGCRVRQPLTTQKSSISISRHTTKLMMKELGNMKLNKTYTMSAPTCIISTGQVSAIPCFTLQQNMFWLLQW
jgi:hypothetical protein